MEKSTILNALLSLTNARTGEISSALNAGKYTTTHTSLHHLNKQSAIIDSPGLQAFGLYHIPAEDIIEWMPDLKPYIGQCRFHNCRHPNEPGGTVKLAVTTSDISKERLALLIRLQEESRTKHH